MTAVKKNIRGLSKIIFPTDLKFFFLHLWEITFGINNNNNNDSLSVKVSSTFCAAI